MSGVGVSGSGVSRAGVSRAGVSVDTDGVAPPGVALPEPAMWQEIRLGRTPDAAALERVADLNLATLGHGGVATVREDLQTQLLGAGPLEPLLVEAGVTDIAVNGDGSVWVDRGTGMERVDIDIGGQGELRRLAVRLAGLAGRRLDETAPFVDGLLPSGVRLHAILPPLVGDGPHLTLRVPARGAVALADLRDTEMFDAPLERVLRAIVLRKVSFVVSGGTGAGKTTLLGAMLAEAPAADRVVVVEDVRELRIRRPQVVRLEARPPNVEGVGEITLTTLVRQALRMRPDRLVVGEVRGAEVRELLTALNTGHEGGCGTIHANTAIDVVARFEALGALAGLGPSAVHAQLASAVEVVVHVRRDGGSGRRRVESVGVVTRQHTGRPEVVEALAPAGAGGDRPLRAAEGWPRLAERLGLPPSDGSPR